jgi:hypothetical protein
MDYEFWLRLVKKEKALVVNDYFTVFISHKESMSHNFRNWPRAMNELVTAWEKNYELLGYDLTHIPKDIKNINNTKIMHKIEDVLYLRPDDIVTFFKAHMKLPE